MSIKAITKEHIVAFENRKLGNPDPPVILKLFDPMGASTWYFTELVTNKTLNSYGLGYGFVILNGNLDLAECGCIDIFEVINARRATKVSREQDDLTEIRMGTKETGVCIERDIHFPIGKYSLDYVIERVINGSPL